MQPIIHGITSTLFLVLPLPFLIGGLFLGVNADQHTGRMKRWTLTSAWFAFIMALLAILAHAMGSTTSVTYLSWPLWGRFGSLAIHMANNNLTLVMLLLVSFVGLIVVRYSYTYLTGDDHEGRFHRYLSLTLGSFLMLIVAGNLWFFFLFWVITSLFLHELLAFYRNRPIALLAARKKYVLHRIADLSLFTAFLLITYTLHTAQLSRIATILMHDHAAIPLGLQVAGGLIVLSAILKSAQFPFHGWLIQVMEAPTPVSALMHAGIIYTGAFLILRTSSLLVKLPWAMNLLVLVGLLSIATASLMMISSTNIKGSLAYSTSAQMGFMLLECGLGLYAIAVLHIISHSVYKAHAFLSSGSVVDHFRVPSLPPLRRTHLGLATLSSLLMAMVIVVGVGFYYGVTLTTQPNLLIMGLILTIALSQLLLQALNLDWEAKFSFLATILGLSLLVSIVYFGLDALFMYFLGSNLPTYVASLGLPQVLIWSLIIITFLGLLFMQQMLPALQKKSFWQTVYVHLYHGLYVDMYLDRWLVRFSPQTPKKRPFPSLENSSSEVNQWTP